MTDEKSLGKPGETPRLSNRHRVFDSPCHEVFCGDQWLGFSGVDTGLRKQRWANTVGIDHRIIDVHRPPQDDVAKGRFDQQVLCIMPTCLGEGAGEIGRPLLLYETQRQVQSGQSERQQYNGPALAPQTVHDADQEQHANHRIHYRHDAPRNSGRGEGPPEMRTVAGTSVEQTRQSITGQRVDVDAPNAEPTKWPPECEGREERPHGYEEQRVGEMPVIVEKQQGVVRAAHQGIRVGEQTGQETDARRLARVTGSRDDLSASSPQQTLSHQVHLQRYLNSGARFPPVLCARQLHLRHARGLARRAPALSSAGVSMNRIDPSGTAQMLIFPEIQIANGSVITRSPSREADIVHDVSPLEYVQWLETEGAQRLHIVDVDAASGNTRENAALIKQILAQTLLPVQVAGGIKTVAQIEDWWEAGAASVVLGTVAITDQALVADVAARHPGAILVNLATKDGLVMIDGWRTQTAFRPSDIVYDLQMSGVAGIIHTDIDRFTDGGSTSLALTMELNQQVVIPVYSSGTVQSLDDVATLRYLPNIHGAIVGHALVNGTIKLREAQEIAGQKDPSPQPNVNTPVTNQGIQSTIRLYLSGYNTSEATRWWNRSLRQALSDTNPYLEMIIPQEDLPLELEEFTARGIQKAYEEALDTAEAVVVLLDGVENEAWTGFECGYARANGTYLLGVTTSGTQAGRSRQRFEAMCDEVVWFEPSDDWSGMVTSIAKEISARLLFDQAT